MDQRKQTRLKGLLQRISDGIAMDVPSGFDVCEICRKTECAQDEWIVCENRIAHAKCLEAIQDKEGS